MKLEEGMYIRIIDPVRIVCTGIGKVVKIAQDTIYAKVNNIELPVAFEKRHIVKASNNIIDLIKAGDYVNEVKVTNVCKNGWLAFGDYDWYLTDEKEIKSIVTKEQFTNMEYKAGD